MNYNIPGMEQKYTIKKILAFHKYLTAFFILMGIVVLQAREKTINMLFFHFEPRTYNLSETAIRDSIDRYIATYREYLYDPDNLKTKMLGDMSFAMDQLGQRKIFKLLQTFRENLKEQERYKDIALKLKVHFILWDEAFEFFQKEAKNPSFSICQIASAFLGGVAQYKNIVSLDQFLADFKADEIFNDKVLRACRIDNKGDLLALPFWASMRSLLIRKDMVQACPGLVMDSIAQNWDSFEAAGKRFNINLEQLRKKGFKNLRSFWAINISDKDMNTLQTLAPAIYSYGGDILKDKFWWKEIAIDEIPTIEGIKKLFSVVKSVGLIEDCTFGELLNRFHAGHFAVVLCGTWDHQYWRATHPDSSSYIEIMLPPAGPEGPATLRWGCNLIIMKQPGIKDYNLEFELLRYLSTDPELQSRYIPENCRMSVLKIVRDSLSYPAYYDWLNNNSLTKAFPNNKEMFKLFDALTQKYHLASILNNVKGASELSPDVWKIIDNDIRMTADEMNKKVIPTYIYYIFYTKINLLFILIGFFLLGFLFIQVVNRVRRFKDKKMNDLTEHLKRILAEKVILEQNEANARIELNKNQTLISSLNRELEEMHVEYDKLKADTALDNKENYLIRIKELDLRNKELQIQLDDTIGEIKSNDRIVTQLQNEIDALKNPEVVIDFDKKTIRKKDGSEFVLSSTAEQYKNDIFRYLEYIARYRPRRIHLLTFGLLDSKFFLKSLRENGVEEYKYKGKLAKVRAGINRTFKNNIGLDLIVPDQSKLYVYYNDPDTLCQIQTRDKDINIALSGIQETKIPEVLTFSGHDAFDYYMINNRIKITSNIQESADLYDAAQKIKDEDSREAELRKAFDLDQNNYPALLSILSKITYGDIAFIQAVEQDLRQRIHELESFLNNDLRYVKNVKEIKKVKREYRELYSWKFVAASKSKYFKDIGARAFDEIIEFERAKITEILERYKQVTHSMQKYLEQFNRLKTVGEYFRVFIDRRPVMDLIKDHLVTEDALIFSPVNEKALKRSIITHLVTTFELKKQGENNKILVDNTCHLFDWLYDNKISISNNDVDVLAIFFGQSGVEAKSRKQIEQLYHHLKTWNE